MLAQISVIWMAIKLFYKTVQVSSIQSMWLTGQRRLGEFFYMYTNEESAWEKCNIKMHVTNHD